MADFENDIIRINIEDAAHLARLQNQGHPRQFPETPTYSEIFHNRKLDQRARLSFWYRGAAESDLPQVAFLPFYENPKITETQSANFSQYNPLGRAGSLYSYTGTSSRKINVDLTFTLAHLGMHEMGIERFMRLFPVDSKESQKLLFTNKADVGTKKGTNGMTTSLSLAVEKMYWTLRYPDIGSALFGSLRAGLVPPDFTEEEKYALGILKNVSGDNTHRVIDTLLFFIALLRTSVVNKANNPLYGPPIIRIDWGTMYQSVPCICKSYSMDWEENAGYHLETLTPMQLKVKLKLEEVRTGDFGKYEAGTYKQRDNLTGWESAINSPHTTDPLPAMGFWKDSN